MLPIARLTSRRLMTLALRRTLRPAMATAATNLSMGNRWSQDVIMHPRYFASGVDAGATVEAEGLDAPEIILDPVPAPQSEFANLKPLEAFELSATMTKNLQAAGFTHLFPIQAESFNVMKDGTDVIGRSKTGSGKTLAFALPIAERLLAQPGKASSSSMAAPRAVVLLPTRELAQQVATEIKRIAPQLRVVDVVGGMPYGQQESALRRGVDILVGTPGRIMDLVQKRRVLSMKEVQAAVLDEADMMLKFGFADDVETILGWMPKERQTALWSATFPKWVNSLAQRFTEDATTIDLVGEDDNNVPTTVSHKAIHAPLRARISVLVNVIRRGIYDGKTLVFTETKQEANDIAIALDMPEVKALHGDLSQFQRQQTMDEFRNGQIKTLVCTDIAARGLDIANVDLVVQYRLPHDKESFVHRAGRTGRAGRVGTDIVFYDRQDAGDVLDLQNRYNVTFTHMAPPHLDNVLGAVVSEIEKKMATVPTDSYALFRDAATRMYEERGIDAFSQVLTLLGGLDTNVGTASMLTGREDMQTVEVTGFNHAAELRRIMEKFDSKNPIRNIQSVDGKFVFDIGLHALDRLRTYLDSLDGYDAKVNPAVEFSKVLINPRHSPRDFDDGYGNSKRFGNRYGRDDSRGRWNGDNRGRSSRDFDSRRSNDRSRNDRWSSRDRQPRGSFLGDGDSPRRSTDNDRGYRSKNLRTQWSDEF